MKTILLGVMVLAIGLGSAVRPTAADGKVEGASRWEYRVLTKAQVIDLGKQDLAAGLNRLGDEGWELVVVDGQYIFKRSRDQVRKQAEELKREIAHAESDLESWKERLAWTERMVKKGYVTDSQVQAEREHLASAEQVVESLRKALKSLPGDAKKSVDNERQPRK